MLRVFRQLAAEKFVSSANFSLDQRKSMTIDIFFFFFFGITIFLAPWVPEVISFVTHLVLYEYRVCIGNTWIYLQ